MADCEPERYNRDVKGWINNKATHELVSITYHGYDPGFTMNPDRLVEVINIDDTAIMPYELIVRSEGKDKGLTFYVDCVTRLQLGGIYQGQVCRTGAGLLLFHPN